MSTADSEAIKTLAQLAIRGEYDQVRQLATFPMMRSRTESGQTALMLAADATSSHRHLVKCIEYFLHVGAEPFVADAAGDTAAHLAARRDHLRALVVLPFDAKWTRNESGLTPLMEAVQADSWRCATHLLHLLRQLRYENGGNVQKRELLDMRSPHNWWSALDIARGRGQTHMAYVIELEMRLTRTDKREFVGLTSSEEAECKLLKRLIIQKDWAALRKAATRLNIDLPNKYGTTPLMWAAINKGIDDSTLEYLLELGDVTCADIGACSCVYVASEHGNTRAVRALIARGAYVNYAAFFTPLMKAARSFDQIGENKVNPADAAETARALLEAGADWSCRVKVGNFGNLSALDMSKKKSELAALLRCFEGKDFFQDSIPSAAELAKLPGPSAMQPNRKACALL